VPPVFGPWQTIWTWHRRLSADGTWDTALRRLLTAADAAGRIDWAVSVDSTIARAHQHATNITRAQGAGSNYTNLLVEPRDHAIGRSRGGLTTKIHHLVDGQGHPLVVLLSAGQAGDSPIFPHPMRQLSLTLFAGHGECGVTWSRSVVFDPFENGVGEFAAVFPGLCVE
jgi:transposase